MLNKYLFTLLMSFAFLGSVQSQTPLTTAPDITVKTIKGDIIQLYALLEQNKIVVIDFFSTSCGPCQTFAPDFQEAYEGFGLNEGNVFFLGVNYNGTNADLIFFDSLFNITLPSCSGLEGGGNIAFETFQIAAYPTVVVIQPDKTIASPHVWEPSVENITAAVTAAGGIFVGTNQLFSHRTKGLSTYPQPASSGLTFELDLDNITDIQVVIKDISGRVLHSQWLPVESSNGRLKHTIDISDTKSGLYILEVYDGENRYAERFLKE